MSKNKTAYELSEDSYMMLNEEDRVELDKAIEEAAKRIVKELESNYEQHLKEEGKE